MIWIGILLLWCLISFPAGTLLGHFISLGEDTDVEVPSRPTS